MEKCLFVKNSSYVLDTACGLSVNVSTIVDFKFCPKCGKELVGCDKINSLMELYACVAGKRRVVCPGYFGFQNPKPAAFVINLPGAMLVKMFSSGMYVL